MKLIKAWLNYQRAKIRRRHDEKVSKEARNQSYKRSGTTDMFHYFFDKIWRKEASYIRRMNPTRKSVLEEESNGRE